MNPIPRTTTERVARAALALTVAGAAMTACSSGEPEATVPTTVATTVPATTTAPTTVAPSTTAPIQIRMPLTGEPIESLDDAPQRPALVAKIPMDDPAAMPHSGLNRADIVFQTIINDSFTRLIAVFHSQDADPLGPIRSGRDQDINIVDALHSPLYGWSGGNPGVTREVREAQADGALVDLNYTTHPDLYYRRDNRNGAPHNLFSSTKSLWSATPDDWTMPTPIFPYLNADEKPEGDPVDQINVTLASIKSHWEYDEATGRYMKWNNRKEHMTEKDGQVWADNVVVTLMDYGVSSIDGQNPLMNSLGANPVYVFSKGTVRPGVWYRTKAVDGWEFYDDMDSKNPIALVPGRTWVEMPRNSEGVLSYRSDGAEVKAETGQSVPTPPTSEADSSSTTPTTESK